MRAIIYKPSKTATQSGRACTKKWVLEFVREEKAFFDPVMNWKGGSEMLPAQVNLKFSTREEAEKYAQKNGIEYTIPSQEGKIKFKIKSYVDNFIKSK
jgi:hypothetical protein